MDFEGVCPLCTEISSDFLNLLVILCTVDDKTLKHFAILHLLKRFHSLYSYSHRNMCK